MSALQYFYEGNLTTTNSSHAKFSSFRQHAQTSVKKEDFATQPVIVLQDEHHAKKCSYLNHIRNKVWKSFVHFDLLCIFLQEE